LLSDFSGPLLVTHVCLCAGQWAVGFRRPDAALGVLFAGARGCFFGVTFGHIDVLTFSISKQRIRVLASLSRLMIGQYRVRGVATLESLY